MIEADAKKGCSVESTSYDIEKVIKILELLGNIDGTAVKRVRKIHHDPWRLSFSIVFELLDFIERQIVLSFFLNLDFQQSIYTPGMEMNIRDHNPPLGI